jgi:hypothetical protein
MATAPEWDALDKAERKADLERRIEETIDRLAAEPSPPTEWQKAKVMDTIDATLRGLFDVASTHLSQVFVEAETGRPLPHPDTNLADPAKLTLDALRSALAELKSRPVQDPPDYL